MNDFSSPLPDRPLCARLLAGLLLSGLLLSGLAGAAWSSPAATRFDTATLERLGIDSRVAAFFQDAPRFRQGQQAVSLVLNGSPLGRLEARFDEQGQLCFTRGFLDSAGLRQPAHSDGPQDDCADFLGEFPAAQVILHPGSEAVELLVPTQALRDPEWSAQPFARGGAAGLLNYDLAGFRSQSAQGPSEYLSAQIEAGFNLGDWIVRSRQLLLQDNGQSSTAHLYAYGQRDLLAWRSTVQLGQISGTSPVFGGVQLSGMQLFPDGVQRETGAGRAVVEGLAHSQSRVEIRQAGVLIYSTLVPEGPFRLTQLPLLDSHGDLHVSVIAGNEAPRQFVVPAASFQGGALASPGYYLSLGRLREADERQPLLAMASGNWGLGRVSSLALGGLGSDAYQALGWALDSRLLPGLSVGLRQNLARDDFAGVSGVRSALSMRAPLFAGIDLDASVTVQGQGYREVAGVGRRAREDDFSNGFSRQYSAGLSWSQPSLGALSLRYSQATRFAGRPYRHLLGSWAKGFRYADVMLIADSEIAAARRRPRAERWDQAPGRELSLRLQVSVPLGDSRRLRSYVRQQGEQLDLGLALNERVSETLSYELAVERDQARREQAWRGQVSALPRYTQLGLGLNRRASGSSYNASLQGAMVVHGQGLTFSPYRVQDTFGIVSVGELPGARVATPQGPVWTDSSGQAVIAGLPAYSPAQLQVHTASLPRHIDIRNGSQVLAAGRGSFSSVDFNLSSRRRLLLEVRDAQGQPLPQGAPVFAPGNVFLTNVVGEGQVFLADIDGPQVLDIALSDSSTCQLHFDPAQEIGDDTLYETGSAVCHAR